MNRLIAILGLLTGLIGLFGQNINTILMGIAIMLYVGVLVLLEIKDKLKS